MNRFFTNKIWTAIIIAATIGLVWSLSLSAVVYASTESTESTIRSALDCPPNRGDPDDNPLLSSDCRPLSPEEGVTGIYTSHDRNPKKVLYEAGRNEIWITGPTIGHSPQPAPITPLENHAQRAAPTGEPPTDPTNLVIETSGLFGLDGSWDASVDPDGEIEYYAYSIGTGTTAETEANVRWWQSTGTETRFHADVALEENQVYYVGLYVVDNEGQFSNYVHSAPFSVTNELLGQDDYEMSYGFSEIGYDRNGDPTVGWSDAQQQDISSFLDLMFPIIYEMYGPPSISYTVSLVRDERNRSAAIFYPQEDEIHMDENAPYQLITHEIIHAWRNDRLISSNELWEYNPTLSGFEEGFAQGASYDLMTEFARRHPDFGLSQMIYQSSHGWDYDFQNVEELRTKDLWSDEGGMNLFWIRYEMAAAAMSKIQLEYPGFYRLFNEEYYRRLNADPDLRVSHDLVVDIIASIAPQIEGKPTAQWIDEQYILAGRIDTGKKVWMYREHYPSPEEYFIFNNVYFYETFSNGYDWKYWENDEWHFHQLNGSEGYAKLYDYKKDTLWQRPLLITPTDNPPAYWGFGKEEINLTSQSSHLPWPGGAEKNTITNLNTFGLYELDLEFTDGSDVVTNTFYSVIGQELYDTKGVFGGIIGANNGEIHINHRKYEPEPAAPVINGAFWITRTWATVPNTDTDSVDSVPGLIDITYIDADGNGYTDTRTINYGSWSGNQLFLFDVANMNHVTVTIPITTTPTPTPTITSTPTVTVTSTPTVTVTSTPTVTVTSTPTVTVTSTPTMTSTPTVTVTSTPTVTVTSTPTMTSTPTVTVTSTPTVTVTSTPTVTVTSTPTVTVTSTPTVTVTSTPTPTPIVTVDVGLTPTPSSTPSPTPMTFGEYKLYLPLLNR